MNINEYDQFSKKKKYSFWLASVPTNEILKLELGNGTNKWAQLGSLGYQTLVMFVSGYREIIFWLTVN